MSIDSSNLLNALEKLNISTGKVLRYSKIADSLDFKPKKFVKGKETKQLLKVGSQKYKEAIYNEVLRRRNLKLAQEEAEFEKKQKKDKAKQKKLKKLKPKLVEKKLVESLKSKKFDKYIYSYENNNSLEDLYNAIKENIGSGSFVSIIFKKKGDNKILQVGIKTDDLGRTIASDYLEENEDKDLTGFENFKAEVNRMIEGEAIGSDPINEDIWEIDYNHFTIITKTIGTAKGKSDAILFESKLIESKEGLCGYLSFLEAGIDSKKYSVNPKALQSIEGISSFIKKNNLPVVVISNGFLLQNSIENIFENNKSITITIKEKKRERDFKCVELNESLIDLVELVKPEPGIEIKHYLIYDEINQHLDYCIGIPKLLSGIYLSKSSKIIKDSKIVFDAKQANVNNKSEEKAPYEYIFFDYETVIDFNNSNCMQSYSLSILHLDNPQLQKLEELDLEGRYKADAADKQKIKRQEALDEISFLRKKNCKTFLGYDCGRQFINWFLEYSHDKVCILIGFNNTNFDNFLLLEDFLKYNDDCSNLTEVKISDIFYNGSQLLNFKIAGRHSLFDIRKHLVGSLKSNCSSFKIESVAKKDCDHAEMQKLHQEGKLINYINTDDKLKEYNEYDVLATAVLYRRYVNALDSIEATRPYAQQIFTIKTIGSLIYKVFQDNKKKLKFELPKLEYQQYDDLQKSKIAGRVEMFNGVQKVQERLVSTDVCSLYPFVMSVLDCYYPCGESIIEVNEYKGDDKIGFYYCDIDQSNLRAANLPNIYAEKKPLENDWNSSAVLENYLISNVMIGLLRKYNCKVTIKNGFVFPYRKKSCEMFGFLLDFMKAKNEQDTYSKKNPELYNPALRETLKLLMNSLSGKVIEGLHLEKTVDIDTVSDYLKIVEKAKSVNFINSIGNKLFLTYEVDAESICAKQQRPIYLGVLIYDYAKRYMFDYSYSKIGKDKLLYTDTDASKFRYTDFIKWKNWIDTNNIIVPHHKEVEDIDPRYKSHRIYDSSSKVFGSFEDELEKCVGSDYLFYCLEKKSWLYAYKKDDTWCSKYRFKGLNGSAQLLSLQEPFIDRKILKHKATTERPYYEEIKYSIRPETEYDVYRYYEDNKQNNIESGNEIKFFEQVYSTGVAYIINSSFRKIVKNSARNVLLEDTGSYNCLMNKIQVQYNLKKIDIYKTIKAVEEELEE